jgi:pyruvate dehydrogenase E1 component
VQLLAQLLKDETIGPRVVPDRGRRGAHLRHADAFPAGGHLLRRRASSTSRGPRELLYYREGQGRTDPGGGHHRGGRAVVMARGGHVLLDARPGDAAVLHLLLGFGFQRVGDLIWAAADSRARGFLLGGTAGRTRSPARACSTRTAPRTSSPRRFPTAAPTTRASATSSPSIVHDGARRMLEAQEMRSTTSPWQRELCASRRCRQGAREGILKGMYRLKEAGRRRFSFWKRPDPARSAGGCRAAREGLGA